MTTGTGAKKTSIFDKLTDSSQYTGSHQHRFDSDGKGRGLAGRDRVVKGSGTTDTPYDDGAPIRDLSQITRTNLRSKDAKKPTRPKSSKQVQEAKQHRCRETNCVNSCSPTSKQGFCSYHMWQESESAKYPKSSKAAPSASPEPINRRHQRSTSSLCQVPQCGNDRGPDGFCLVHAHKTTSADPPQSIDEAQDETTNDLGATGEKRCIIQSCSVSVYRMGYCKTHFQEMQSLDDHAEDKQASAGSSPSSRQTKANAKAADKTLSRLTDPKLYTGSHQHRFDKSGNGIGLDGRDSVAKGSGTSAKYHGGKINDISQVLRQG